MVVFMALLLFPRSETMPGPPAVDHRTSDKFSSDIQGFRLQLGVWRMTAGAGVVWSGERRKRERRNAKRCKIRNNGIRVQFVRGVNCLFFSCLHQQTKKNKVPGTRGYQNKKGGKRRSNSKQAMHQRADGEKQAHKQMAADRPLLQTKRKKRGRGRGRGGEQRRGSKKNPRWVHSSVALVCCRVTMDGLDRRRRQRAMEKRGGWRQHDADEDALGQHVKVGACTADLRAHVTHPNNAPYCVLGVHSGIGRSLY